MPVRSSGSRLLRWPDAQSVDHAARRWASDLAARDGAVVRVGYFGSYARGDWGVGSDLDLVVILSHCPEPFERRALRWDTTTLPVPADVLVYTAAEWDRLGDEPGLVRTAAREATWVYPRAA